MTADGGKWLVGAFVHNREGVRDLFGSVKVLPESCSRGPFKK